MLVTLLGIEARSSSLSRSGRRSHNDGISYFPIIQRFLWTCAVLVAFVGRAAQTHSSASRPGKRRELKQHRPKI
jgi:hypothetical protein